MKTSELSGAALDYVVAVCEKPGVHGIGMDGKLRAMPLKPFGDPVIYSPSADWAQGGPIIEREGINLVKVGVKLWRATYQNYATFEMHDNSPLIAAMRCYVASKLGEEVEIPDELQKVRA